jgi:hypothetical protein
MSVLKFGVLTNSPCCLSCFRPDAGGKVAKTDEMSSLNQYNNVYDQTTDYSAVGGYPTNSAYNYNTAQWPGYGTAQQQVGIRVRD